MLCVLIQRRLSFARVVSAIENDFRNDMRSITFLSIISLKIEI